MVCGTITNEFDSRSSPSACLVVVFLDVQRGKDHTDRRGECILHLFRVVLAENSLVRFSPDDVCNRVLGTLRVRHLVAIVTKTRLCDLSWLIDLRGRLQDDHLSHISHKDRY